MTKHPDLSKYFRHLVFLEPGGHQEFIGWQEDQPIVTIERQEQEVWQRRGPDGHLLAEWALPSSKPADRRINLKHTQQVAACLAPGPPDAVLFFNQALPVVSFGLERPFGISLTNLSSNKLGHSWLGHQYNRGGAWRPVWGMLSRDGSEKWQRIQGPYTTLPGQEWRGLASCDNRHYAVAALNHKDGLLFCRDNRGHLLWKQSLPGLYPFCVAIVQQQLWVAGRQESRESLVLQIWDHQGRCQSSSTLSVPGVPDVWIDQILPDPREGAWLLGCQGDPFRGLAAKVEPSGQRLDIQAFRTKGCILRCGRWDGAALWVGGQMFDAQVPQVFWGQLAGVS